MTFPAVTTKTVGDPIQVNNGEWRVRVVGGQTVYGAEVAAPVTPTPEITVVEFYNQIPAPETLLVPKTYYVTSPTEPETCGFHVLLGTPGAPGVAWDQL